MKVSRILAAIATALAIISCATIIFCAPMQSETYTREMTVTEINVTEDVVVLIDTEGHEWAFYGVENWLVGDECTCTMDNNGTENITDDAIIFTTYNGN